MRAAHLVRRDTRRRTVVCVECLARREAPIVERAVGFAAEALAWPDGRVTLVLTIRPPACGVPVGSWRPVLLMERSRGDRKQDEVVVADCPDLVDPTDTLIRLGIAVRRLGGRSS